MKIEDRLKKLSKDIETLRKPNNFKRVPHGKLEEGITKLEEIVKTLDKFY